MISQLYSLKEKWKSIKSALRSFLLTFTLVHSFTNFVITIFNTTLLILEMFLSKSLNE